MVGLSYPCLRCGADLVVEMEQGPGMTTGEDTGRCAGCGTVYPEPALDEIMNLTGAGEVPSVHTFGAARMLGRPGETSWVANE